MTDADDRLKALFALDEPPARDPGFTTAVMEEIARREFRADMLQLAGVTALGALVLWALWPVVTPILTTASEALLPAAAGLALAAALTWLAGERPAEALGAET